MENKKHNIIIKNHNLLLRIEVEDIVCVYSDDSCLRFVVSGHSKILTVSRNSKKGLTLSKLMESTLSADKGFFLLGGSRHPLAIINRNKIKTVSKGATKEERWISLDWDNQEYKLPYSKSSLRELMSSLEGQ